MNITKLHMTKKRFTALAAICSSVFLLAACEPGDDQQAADQPETTEQDGAPTYGQRDRDLGTQEDPATQDPAMQDPAMQDQETPPPPAPEEDTTGNDPAF